jgi:hypothetical protein
VEIGVIQPRRRFLDVRDSPPDDFGVQMISKLLDKFAFDWNCSDKFVKISGESIVRRD